MGLWCSIRKTPRSCSGLTTTTTDFSTDQTLTVAEPPKLEGPKVNGSNLELNLIGQANKAYLVQSSTNLRDWAGLTTVTNSGRKTAIIDPLPSLPTLRFYRLRGQ